MNKLAEYYDKKVRLYKPSKIREKKIMELLGTNIKNKKILDIGCSDGTFGAKLVKKGAIVYGVDISPHAVDIAKKKLKNAYVADLNNQKLPFNSKTFDFIITSEIIEHLYNPSNLLVEAKRILKDKGMLTLTTPNFLYWGNRIKFLFGNFKYEKSGIFDESHVHFYTYKSLKTDLKMAGFEIIKENHVFAGPGIFYFFKRYLPALFSYQLVVYVTKQ